MFKNLTIYRAKLASITATSLEESLQRAVFAPCEPTQPVSAGWVPPRGHGHGQLVEVIDGEWHIKLQVEQRILPSSVVATRVKEIAAQIEEQTGRKPGKKALKDLKEQATHDLLPKCFTKLSTVRAWLSPAASIIAVDAPSAGRADEIVSMLVKAVDGLAVHLIQTAEAPAACMAAWLMDGEPPAGFTIDREGELKSEDEMRSTVKYQRHALDTDDVRQHLTSGKRPTKLAMSFKDRVSFVLTDTLQLKKIAFLDLAFEGRDKPERDEQFDADAVIATCELGDLIPAMIDALGGEHDFLGSQATLVEEPAQAKPVTAPQAPVAQAPVANADPLYDLAVAIVREHKRASISLVQRYLRIGYNHAAFLLERMERDGVVSPMRSDGGREVLKAVPA